MKTFEPKSREEWRKWLEERHSDTDEIWLVYYKKHTNKATVSYAESVEEALCFGWIDGIKKRIDDERYTHRFTPRRKGSKWSPKNIATAERMIATGKMAPAGSNAFEQRKEYDEPASGEFVKDTLAPQYEELLKKNKTAWTNFNNLPRSHKKNYILWLNSAKKDATKLKRINEAIELLEKNKNLGMK